MVKFLLGEKSMLFFLKSPSFDLALVSDSKYLALAASLCFRPSSVFMQYVSIHSDFLKFLHIEHSLQGFLKHPGHSPHLVEGMALVSLEGLLILTLIVSGFVSCLAGGLGDATTFSKVFSGEGVLRTILLLAAGASLDFDGEDGLEISNFEGDDDTTIILLSFTFTGLFLGLATGVGDFGGLFSTVFVFLAMGSSMISSTISSTTSLGLRLSGVTFCFGSSAFWTSCLGFVSTTFSTFFGGDETFFVISF